MTYVYARTYEQYELNCLLVIADLLINSSFLLHQRKNTMRNHYGSLLSLAVLIFGCDAFVPMGTTSTTSQQQRQQASTSIHASSQFDQDNRESLSPQRRNMLVSMASAAMGMLAFQQPALAVPMVTVDEFAIILRDSPLSVQVVEFSGPKSENVVVKLVDGTTFGIKDIVESSTDPRSPLKLSAACRESGVKTKFVDLEAMLASSPKKKLYTNERVQEAARKEKERLERIQRDEEDRLAQLAKMEKEEAAASGN